MSFFFPSPYRVLRPAGGPRSRVGPRAAQMIVLSMGILIGCLPIGLSAQQEAYDFDNLDPRDSAALQARLNNVSDRSRFLEAFRLHLANKVQESGAQAVQRFEQVSQGIYVQKNIYDKIMGDLDAEEARINPAPDTLVYRNRRRLTPQQNVNIFGWHPYWMQSAYKSYNFELLSVVSWFSYDIDASTGRCRNPESIAAFKGSDIVDLAHKSGCKVLLTMTLFGGGDVSRFLNSNFQVQQTAIDSVFAAIAEKGADGVDIDFENVPAASRKAFTFFVNEVVRQAKARNPQWFVNLTLPAYDFAQAFDFENLSPLIDLYVIMGYAFKTELDATPGPIAPLYANGAKGKLDLAGSVEG